MKNCDRPAFPYQELVQGESGNFPLDPHVGLSKLELLSALLLVNRWSSLTGNETFVRSSIRQSIRVAMLLLEEVAKV